jgi:hypothetical protein
MRAFKLSNSQVGDIESMISELKQFNCNVFHIEVLLTGSFPVKWKPRKWISIPRIEPDLNLNESYSAFNLLSIILQYSLLISLPI